MTPQEAIKWLRKYYGSGNTIANLIDSLAAARQLGTEVTLAELKPSLNYFVVRDDDVVVVGETSAHKAIQWPDERLEAGFGFSLTNSDLSYIRSIHEIPAAWFPDVPPVKTEQEKLREAIAAELTRIGINRYDPYQAADELMAIPAIRKMIGEK